MTNAEINEAISGWFEAKPEPLDWVIIDQPIPSAKGFWLHTNSGYERGDVSVTIPLDYFTSEDANARLLEAMRDRNPVLRFVEAPIDAWVVYLWTAGQPVSDGIPMTNVSLADCSRSPDRKTCVVLAFLKFAGIAHKRDGGEK